MAQKIVQVDGLGELILAKRKGSRHIRLSVLPDGRVRVGIPSWVPYSAGINFAKSRSDWIAKHSGQNRRGELKDGDLIGKSHRLKFSHDPTLSRTSTRLGANSVNITSNLTISHPSVQKKAESASERALKKEAEALLPRRVSQIAADNRFDYSRLKIKKMVSRWGSCSGDKVITLNYFLMQLPWPLIDYVIVHELMHTKHLNHSPAFWAEFEEHLPGAKAMRRQMRAYRPSITPS